jgi:hypothetical protein
MKFYLAGVMRGSETDSKTFVNQNYRSTLKKLIEEYFPNSEIYDPLGQCDIKKSNSNTFQESRKVYFEEAAEVKNCDVLIAFLPEASMGVAIEMWQAYFHNVYIITISKMIENWTIKFLSDLVVGDLYQFDFLLNDGTIQSLHTQFLAKKKPRFAVPFRH